MENRISIRTWDVVHRLRWFLLAVAITAGVWAQPIGKFLSADPSNQAIFENNKARQDNQKFEETFGSNETIVIGISAPDILDPTLIQWMKSFSNFFLKQDGIAHIQSLNEFKGFKKEFLGLEEVPLAELYLKGEIKREVFLKSLKDAREITAHLINSEGRFGVIFIELKKALSGELKHRTIQSIRRWIDKHPPAGKVFLSGTAVEQDTFVGHIQRDHDRFVPLTFALIILMASLTQWNFMAACYPAFVIGLTLVTTEAVMVLSGHRLNMVTSLVAPVILIVSVSDAIHYQSYAIHDQYNPSPGNALKKLFQNLGMACWMTTATTIAGFLSLMTSSVPAIRQFGMYSALGTFLAYVWTVLLLPFFYPFARNYAKGRKDTLLAANAFTYWVSRAIYHSRIFIMVLCLPLLIIGIYQSNKVRIETDILKSFKPNDAFRQATEVIQANTGGVYTIEIQLDDAETSLFSDRENLQRLIEIQDAIKAMDSVLQVHYVTDILKVLDRVIRGEEKSQKDIIPPEFYLNKYLKGLLQSTSSELSRIRTASFRSTRMTVDLNTSSTAETLRVCKKIENVLSRQLPHGWKYSIAGQTYLLALMSEQLVRNQMMSLGTSFVAITFMMMLSLSSIWLGVLSGVINAIPLALLGAFMKYRDIPLNTATTLVAGVSFGLIIDNAIHVLFRFKEAKRSKSSDIIKEVMIYCAKPLTYSTVILASGFSVTLFGSVQPTIQFGMLMVTVLILALAANLILLPAFFGQVSEKESKE